MSSTDDTRSSRRTYCAVSIRAERAAASAVTRGTDASAGNRSGASKPSAAKISRLPTTWTVDIVGRSRSGTRLTAPVTSPARRPGSIVIHTPGSVP